MPQMDCASVARSSRETGDARAASSAALQSPLNDSSGPSTAAAVPSGRWMAAAPVPAASRARRSKGSREFAQTTTSDSQQSAAKRSSEATGVNSSAEGSNAAASDATISVETVGSNRTRTPNDASAASTSRQ